MNVRIEFDVRADTLPAAILDAEAKLAKFLGDGGNVNEWHISLTCTPDVETRVGGVPAWKIEVEAVRGGRYGKP